MTEPVDVSESGDTPDPGPRPPRSRRDFLASMSMTGGLVAGYGTFAYMAGRFLYPAGDDPTQWAFVNDVKSLPVGSSLTYRSPDGASIVVVRQGAGETGEDFLALSDVCPHLGCRVHWEAQNDRFFCPCHNGTFDRTGKATGGPPEKAGQELKRYPLKVESGLLYIEVPTVETASREDRGGHDACLRPPDEGLA